MRILQSHADFIEFEPTKKDLKHFFKLGGFLEGVKIGKGSPYYAGIDKQRVLVSLLKFMETHKTVENLKELHSKIRYLAGVME